MSRKSHEYIFANTGNPVHCNLFRQAKIQYSMDGPEFDYWADAGFTISDLHAIAEELPGEVGLLPDGKIDDEHVVRGAYHGSLYRMTRNAFNAALKASQQKGE